MLFCQRKFRKLPFLTLYEGTALVFSLMTKFPFKFYQFAKQRNAAIVFSSRAKRRQQNYVCVSWQSSGTREQMVHKKKFITIGEKRQ